MRTRGSLLYSSVSSRQETGKRKNMFKLKLMLRPARIELVIVEPRSKQMDGDSIAV